MRLPVAVVPEDHEHAVRELYSWLGVAGVPRFGAIVQRIEVFTASPPTPSLVEAVGTIFRHLGTRIGNEQPGDHSLM